MLTKTLGQRALRTTIKNEYQTAAANTAAVTVIAAAARRIHCVHHLQWSYNGTPTGGKLTIDIGGTTEFEVDIVTGGPGGFGIELAGAANQTVTITLAAGGAGVVGKLNVQYTTELDGSEYK